MMETIQSNAQLLNRYDPDRPGTPAVSNEYTGPFATSFLSTRDVNDFMDRIGYQDPTEGYKIGQLPDPDQPPQDYDPSGPGGGGGNYDPTSDPIDFPGLPSGGALSSGSIKAFGVSQGIMAAVFHPQRQLHIIFLQA